MGALSYTLLTDGSSDQVLKRVISWAIRQHSSLALDAQWANLAQLRPPPTQLADRVIRALELYPCDLLFMHRDSESEPPETRRQEIESAIRSSAANVPVVCVIPVRMQEAWFLIDELAIREAANNPGGKIKLEIPLLRDLERHPNPKRCLHDLLKRASELKGRRFKKIRPGKLAHRLAEIIEDYSPLRELPSFQVFELDLVKTLNEHGWASPPRDAD